MAKRVLPQPAEPQSKVGRPLGKPPSVISSSPVMPVGHFSTTGTAARALVEFINYTTQILIVLDSRQDDIVTVNLKAAKQ